MKKWFEIFCVGLQRLFITWVLILDIRHGLKGHLAGRKMAPLPKSRESGGNPKDSVVSCTAYVLTIDDAAVGP